MVCAFPHFIRAARLAISRQAKLQREMECICAFALHPGIAVYLPGVTFLMRYSSYYQHYYRFKIHEPLVPLNPANPPKHGLCTSYTTTLRIELWWRPAAAESSLLYLKTTRLTGAKIAPIENWK